MVIWVTQRQKKEKPRIYGTQNRGESAVYKAREALSVLFAEGLCMLTTG